MVAESRQRRGLVRYGIFAKFEFCLYVDRFIDFYMCSNVVISRSRIIWNFSFFECFIWVLSVEFL